MGIATVAKDKKPCRSAKRKFYDRVSAETRARTIAAREGFSIYVYNCPFCKWWHLTRQPQRMPVNRAQRITFSAPGASKRR